MPSVMDWLPVTLPEAVAVVVSVATLYAAIVLLTRIFGLRSFSKMSTADFVITVAIGSLFGAAVASPNPTVGVAVVALVGLLAGKFLVAWLTRRFTPLARLLENQPLLLMDGPEILRANLDRAQVTEGELRAKLREANVLRLEQVRAVVLETTGDVSVLHAGDSTEVEPWLLEGVERSSA